MRTCLHSGEVGSKLASDVTVMTNSVAEPRIRAATAADVPVIGQIVEQAYRHYIPRIGKPPGPMVDDYAARVSEGVVWVIEEGSTITGIIVLLPRPDYLLLDNIAVSPARQGAGLGRRLLVFAEMEALRRGYNEIRLYTHQKMTENQRLYAAIGYKEIADIMGRVYATSGYVGAMRFAAKEGQKLYARKELNAILIAEFYARLGDKDEAFKWLDLAYRERDSLIVIDEPIWDPLRSDPRFKDMLRHIGLPIQ